MTWLADYVPQPLNELIKVVSIVIGAIVMTSAQRAAKKRAPDDGDVEHGSPEYYATIAGVETDSDSGMGTMRNSGLMP